MPIPASVWNQVVSFPTHIVRHISNKIPSNISMFLLPEGILEPFRASHSSSHEKTQSMIHIHA